MLSLGIVLASILILASILSYVAAVSIPFQNCIEDYISAIKIVVNFSLKEDNEPNARHPKPVLNPLSNTTTIEVNGGRKGILFLESVDLVQEIDSVPELWVSFQGCGFSGH